MSANTPDDLCRIILLFVEIIRCLVPGDPLSQILTFAGVQTAASTGLEAGGGWAVRVGSLPTLKCNAIRYGECRLEASGQRWHLRAG